MYCCDFADGGILTAEVILKKLLSKIGLYNDILKLARGLIGGSTTTRSRRARQLEIFIQNNNNQTGAFSDDWFIRIGKYSALSHLHGLPSKYP